MKTAVVNFKTTPEMKKGLQQISKAIDIPVSVILNECLIQIADAKSLEDVTIPPDWIMSKIEKAKLEGKLP